MASPQYALAMMAPIATPPPAQAMPAPSLQPRAADYDPNDALAGTGIDLRTEDQLMTDILKESLEARASRARTGFAQHPPGSRSSFYGAGPMNQPGEPVSAESQEEYNAMVAREAWEDAAVALATTRAQEMNDPLLMVSQVHRRADKIAKEHGLTLNLDLRNPQANSIGRMRGVQDFPKPTVKVTTKVGPDGALVHTTGSWLPNDAYLADQIALISLSGRHRLRDLLGEANRIAKHRQMTCHGDVPDEWKTAAAPLHTNGQARESPARTGMESAVSPRTNPLKRPLDSRNGEPPAKQVKMTSTMATSMRDIGKAEREWEEARLRKRQKRKDGPGEPSGNASRAGSVAPGTPASATAEPEKQMTKKELKRTQSVRATEASSHANQNSTSSMFAGFGGAGSLFGKKKAGKTYDWMTKAASGPASPSPLNTKNVGNASGATNGQPVSLALTSEGRNRLGTWREDREKGRNIQLRDWVAALEADAIEPVSLQSAYMMLDGSNPK